MEPVTDWKKEAQKQAAAAGELKIALAKRLKDVDDRCFARRMAIVNAYGADDTQNETVRTLIEVLERDLQDEMEWIRSIIGPQA